MNYSAFLQHNYRIKQNVRECWASKSRKIGVTKTRRHNAPKQYNISMEYVKTCLDNTNKLEHW